MSKSAITPTKEKPYLHLGSGKTIFPNFLNVDCVHLPGVDTVWDLNVYPWPFESNAWDKILAFHVLEHLLDLNKALEELYRILAPGGCLEIAVPHMAGWGAWNDPTHCHFFTRRSFDYFIKNGDWNYYYSFGFNTVESRNVFGIGKSKLLNGLLNPILNTKFYDYYLWKIIPCAEVRVKISK